MIDTIMTGEMLTGVPVTVGEQLAASTLAGPIGPVIDLSWSYFHPPFSLGQICKKGQL